MISRGRFWGCIAGILVSLFCEARELRYCVSVPDPGLDPFREIVDGQQVAAYFLMTRPYLSQNSEPGILSAFGVSPDGSVFTGRVNPALRFNDGSPVSPLEAAYGIVRGLSVRPLGRKIAIDGSRFKDGIRVIDAQTFEIHLRSKIRNQVGVLREALSNGSSHNRMWPVKLTNGRYDPAAPVIVARFPYSFDRGDVVFRAGAEKIRIVGRDRCKDAEFGLVPDLFETSRGRYHRVRSRAARQISVQTHSIRVDQNARAALIGWIRSAFVNLPDELATESVGSFFLEGEGGHDPASRWENRYDEAVLGSREWVLAVENPAFVQLIARKAAKDGFRIRFVPFAGSNAAYDARVIASAIHGTRHVILQDLLEWSESRTLFAKTPATVRALERISALSASTIPPPPAVFHEFERISRRESSFAPVARRFVQAYSKVGAPLVLNLNEFGEHHFHEPR